MVKKIKTLCVCFDERAALLKIKIIKCIIICVTSCRVIS